MAKEKEIEKLETEPIMPNATENCQNPANNKKNMSKVGKKSCQEVRHCGGGNYSEEQEQCELEKLKAEIERLTAENKKLTDDNNMLVEKVKLTQAELINYRRRKDEETQSILKYSNQGIIENILPIVDNFERALNSNVNEVSEKFLAGIRMIYDSMLSLLKQFEVEEINRKGQVFDPKQEEALLTDSVAELDDDIVTEVLLKGYKLKDRVIRPAKVKINQK